MRGIVKWPLPENRTTNKRSLQVPNSVSPVEGRRFQLLKGREERAADQRS